MHLLDLWLIYLMGRAREGASFGLMVDLSDG